MNLMKSAFFVEKRYLFLFVSILMHVLVCMAIFTHGGKANKVSVDNVLRVNLISSNAVNINASNPSADYEHANNAVEVHSKDEKKEMVASNDNQAFNDPVKNNETETQDKSAPAGITDHILDLPSNNELDFSQMSLDQINQINRDLVAMITDFDLDESYPVMIIKMTIGEDGSVKDIDYYRTKKEIDLDDRVSDYLKKLYEIKYVKSGYEYVFSFTHSLKP